MRKLNKKHMYGIDFIVIALTLVGMFFVVDYARPLAISPTDNFFTTETNILFSFKNADKLFIDDNAEFSSPDEIFVKDNIIISLEPGVYYWKAGGILNSEVRTFKIESKVDLKLKKIENCEDCYGIVNAGNLDLNVDVYNGSLLTGNIVLQTSDEKNASGTKFVGRQNE